MAVAISAALLSASDPQPVQVAITGTTAGQMFEVRGTAADGSEWEIPGGVGTSTGGQILLIDNRAPLNSVVTYVAVVAGDSYTSTVVTIDYDGVAVVQTLDGQTVVEVEIASVTEPRKGAPRANVFEIAGRSDPAVRLDVPGSYEYSWELETVGADSDVLLAILRTGRPIVRRTVIGMRDLQTVVLGVVTGWADELTSDGLHTWRRWSLTVREIADPEPSKPLVAYTWNDFDAAMDSRTWDDFDDLFDTWAEFDAADWAQY